jgi:K+/H+ antiporter YhaU regulatory subunit KhtT
MRLQALEVPKRLVGVTLADAQLRSLHGLNIIAISKVDQYGTEKRYAPKPDYVLAKGDLLVAVGTTEDVESFERMRRPDGGGARKSETDSIGDVENNDP